MNKELARYFFMLIDKDLQFSFNGMGLPNNACEWLENQLMQENFDKVEEFIKLRYAEQNKKSQKKHKFRAMTNSEFCGTYVSGENFCRRKCSLCRQTGICELAQNRNSISKKPYKTKDGKYIMIEVKE